MIFNLKNVITLSSKCKECCGRLVIEGENYKHITRSFYMRVLFVVVSSSFFVNICEYNWV